MRNYKYCIMFTGMLSLLMSSSEGMALNCTATPDCASLGYTMDVSKCAGAALKCPWDLSKVVCKEKEEVTVGAVVYGDGTVSKGIISGKSPIGLVFDTANRLALALTDVKKDGTAGSEGMKWSSIDYDIPSLMNCSVSDIPTGSNLTPISCGVDGKDNTNKMLACGSSCGGTPAATAVNNYQPADCTKDFCKKTKWFLPSLKDLQNIYLQKTQIDVPLMLLSGSGATSLGAKHYWSSTEYTYYGAWAFGMSSGRSWYDKYNTYYVRPIVKF